MEQIKKREIFQDEALILVLLNAEGEEVDYRPFVAQVDSSVPHKFEFDTAQVVTSYSVRDYDHVEVVSERFSRPLTVQPGDVLNLVLNII